MSRYNRNFEEIMTQFRHFFLALTCVLAVACGDDDASGDVGTRDAGGDSTSSDTGFDGGSEIDSGTEPGSLEFTLEAEDTITDGLSPEGGDEAILDGWAVDFDQYVIAIGEVDLQFATDASVTAEDADILVVDLTTVPPAGLPLWSFDTLATGRWEVFYLQAHAGEGTRHESVTEADFMEMSDNDCTYLIRGSLNKTDGRSCPPATLATPPAGTTPDADGCFANTTIAFDFCAEAETAFGPCESEDGPTGVAVTGGTTQSASLTIHGDHIFFNGFPEGDEGAVMRLAQWLADCDLDLDGTVTRAELEAIEPSDLAELDARYDLSAPFPDLPLDNMWNYLRAQLKTQGHFQGEGECPFDGVAHED